MATTVKVDEMATTASTNFLNAINNQIGPGFSALNSAGNTLADSTHWSGGNATTFQTDIWPTLQKDMQKMQGDLRDLQKKINTCLNDIKTAGG